MLNMFAELVNKAEYEGGEMDLLLNLTVNYKLALAIYLYKD